MIVIVKKRNFIEIEKNVDFPIYRVQYFDNGAIYTKILSPDREINIQTWIGEDKIEIEIDTPSFNDDDYSFGKGIYSLKEDKFNDILKEVKKFINEIY